MTCIRHASLILPSPYIFVDTPVYEPDDHPFYVLLGRLNSDGVVVDHVTIQSHTRDISHLTSDRSQLRPPEVHHTSPDSDSEAQVTDDEDMFNLRSDATMLRRAGRARIIRYRREVRHADTKFGEYATYSPLVRWGPHGYKHDGLPYIATSTDSARSIYTPVSVMAIPMSRADLSRVNEVLLHMPAPQRVLLSITDPDEHQRPIQILAGDRLDPPCSNQQGVRCPRQSPLHVDPAPRDACDIHGPTRRVAATFCARRGYPVPNDTPSTVEGHICITHPTRPVRLADFDGAAHARRSRRHDPENLNFSFWPLFGASNEATDVVHANKGWDTSHLNTRRCEVLIQQIVRPPQHRDSPPVKHLRLPDQAPSCLGTNPK